MADNTDESGGGTIRVRNIQANRQFSKEMTVQRLTVNTGDEKSAESDLMEEVKAGIDNQTNTLESAIKSMNTAFKEQTNRINAAMSGDATKDKTVADLDKDLSNLLKKLNASIIALTNSTNSNTGEEIVGESGPGDASAKSKRFRAADNFADAIIKENKALLELSESVDDATVSIRDLFVKGAVSRIHGNLVDFGNSIQGITTKLYDLSGVKSGVIDRFSDSMERAASGSVSFFESMVDVGSGIFRGGDNIKDTFALIQEAASSDLISPLGILGDDVQAVSKELMQSRRSLRNSGSIASQIMDWDKLNNTTLMLYDMQKRAGIQDEFNASNTQRIRSKQLEYYQLIATNTGKTAEEVVKLNLSVAKDLASAQAAGILTGTQKDNFLKAIGLFNGAGQSGIAGLVSSVAQSGGSLDYYLSQNPEMASSIATAYGGMDKIRELFDVINSADSMGTGQFTEALKSTTLALQDTNFTGVAGAANINETLRKIIGEAGLARDFSDTPNGDSARGLFTWIKDVGANMIGINLSLVSAVMLNTVALWSNTAALGGGMLKGIGGILGRGKGAVGKGIGKVLGAGAGAIGAGKTALGAGGRMLGAGAGALGRVGLGGVLRAIPGIGLVAGLGYGAYKAAQGDWTGAALSAGAGVAGLVPGWGTAASVGLSGALAAREMGAFGSDGSSVTSPVAPIPSQTTVNQGIRNDTQRLLMENNRLVSRMISLLETNNEIGGDIKQNTAKAVVSASPGFFDNLFGSSDTEIASSSGA